MTKKPRPPFRLKIEDLGLEFEPAPIPGTDVLRVDPGPEIRSFHFDICPICLANPQLTREHIPPEALGGRFRTMTCSRCNNRLGSRVDDEFVAWCMGAIGRVRVSSAASGVKGERKLPATYYRRTTDDKFVLLVMGTTTDDERQMMLSGDFVFSVTELDEHRYRLSALKQIYLAYCIAKREIPADGLGVEIRAALVAARDAPANRDVPPSRIANKLKIGRSLAEPGDPAIAICKVVPESGPSWGGALLARSVAISWPAAPSSAT